MKRSLVTVYGVLCTLMFLTLFVWLAAFLLEVGVAKSINSGPATHPSLAVVVNLALIGAFGLFHSLMARAWFKSVWTRIIPPAVERSTYLLQSSLLLALLIWQWRPLPTAIWSASGWAALPFYLGFAAGVIIVNWSIWLMLKLRLRRTRRLRSPF